MEKEKSNNSDLINQEPIQKKPKLLDEAKSSSAETAENEVDKYPEWTVKANECINIIFGRTEEELENKKIKFHPNFTHQIFKNEKIVGYKGLEINMFYTPGFDVQIQTIFSEKSKKELGGPIPDDIFKYLSEKLPKGQPINDRVSFLQALQHQDKSFAPLGTLISSYSKHDKNNSTSFEIWKAHLSEDVVKSFHEKIELFLLFFIDGANYIELEDPAWDVYYVYSKTEENKQVKYSLVGFSTVYKHYAYPDRQRLRISQVLILPPYQKAGHGAHLLKAIYKIAFEINAKDVTVEDASPDFSRVRDFVDVHYLLNNVAFFQKNPMKPLDKKAIDSLRDQSKLCTEQLKYCYDLISYRNLNKQDEEDVKEFRLQMKRKLFKRYEDVLSQYEDANEKKKELQTIYNEFEKRFSDTISKLDKMHD